MKPPRFRYRRPSTLAEALACLAEHGDEARPLAGGQSLIPMLNLRLTAPGVVVDLNRVGDPLLHRLDLEDGALRVGALVRQRALERWPPARRLGALADGLALTGHVAIRNRGTVGGSLSHADPAAELPLTLLALGGTVVTAAAGGHEGRELAAEEFFRGFLTTALAPGELVVEVRFGAAGAGRNEGSALAEVALRHGDFGLGSAAGWLRLGDDGRVAAARIAVGAVADRPQLVNEAAEVLVGSEPAAAARDAGRAAAAAVDVTGSRPAPAGYRRHLVEVLVARAVERAAARALAPAAEPAGDGQKGSPDRPPGGRATPSGRCTVNGRSVRLDGVEPRRLLSDFLRHDLGLRGTHVGCEHGVCGACTVRLDGAAVRSCLLLAVQADGSEIQTVEGLAGADGRLHALQESFRRHFALQCGFCTPGILLSAAEFLEETSGAGGVDRRAGEREVRELLSGHLCRCTGYEGIVAGILDAAQGR